MNVPLAGTGAIIIAPDDTLGVVLTLTSTGVIVAENSLGERFTARIQESVLKRPAPGAAVDRSFDGLWCWDNGWQRMVPISEGYDERDHKGKFTDHGRGHAGMRGCEPDEYEIEDDDHVADAARTNSPRKREENVAEAATHPPPYSWRHGWIPLNPHTAAKYRKKWPPKGGIPKGGSKGAPGAAKPGKGKGPGPHTMTPTMTAVKDRKYTKPRSVGDVIKGKQQSAPAPASLPNMTDDELDVEAGKLLDNIFGKNKAEPKVPVKGKVKKKPKQQSDLALDNEDGILDIDLDPDMADWEKELLKIPGEEKNSPVADVDKSDDDSALDVSWDEPGAPTDSELKTAASPETHAPDDPIVPAGPSTPSATPGGSDAELQIANLKSINVSLQKEIDNPNTGPGMKTFYKGEIDKNNNKINALKGDKPSSKDINGKELSVDDSVLLDKVVFNVAKINDDGSLELENYLDVDKDGVPKSFTVKQGHVEQMNPYDTNFITGQDGKIVQPGDWMQYEFPGGGGPTWGKFEGLDPEGKAIVSHGGTTKAIEYWAADVTYSMKPPPGGVSNAPKPSAPSGGKLPKGSGGKQLEVGDTGLFLGTEVEVIGPGKFDNEVEVKYSDGQTGSVQAQWVNKEKSGKKSASTASAPPPVDMSTGVQVTKPIKLDGPAVIDMNGASINPGDDVSVKYYTNAGKGKAKVLSTMSDNSMQVQFEDGDTMWTSSINTTLDKAHNMKASATAKPTGSSVPLSSLKKGDVVSYTSSTGKTYDNVEILTDNEPSSIFVKFPDGGSAIIDAKSINTINNTPVDKSSSKTNAFGDLAVPSNADLASMGAKDIHDLYQKWQKYKVANYSSLENDTEKKSAVDANIINLWKSYQASAAGDPIPSHIDGTVQPDGSSIVPSSAPSAPSVPKVPGSSKKGKKGDNIEWHSVTFDGVAKGTIKTAHKDGTYTVIPENMPWKTIKVNPNEIYDVGSSVVINPDKPPGKPANPTHSYSPPSQPSFGVPYDVDPTVSKPPGPHKPIEVKKPDITEFLPDVYANDKSGVAIIPGAKVYHPNEAGLVEVKSIDPDGTVHVVSASYQSANKSSYPAKELSVNAYRAGENPYQNALKNTPSPKMVKGWELSGNKAYSAAPNAKDLGGTSSQKSALKYYTGSGYGDMNSYLRFGKDNGGNVKEHVKNLDSFFEKSPPLEHDILVTRGVHSPEKMFGPVGSKVGKSFHDKAYMSTTSKVGGAGFGNTKIRIKVPAGTRVIRPNGVGVYGDSEGEVLLPRGMKFIIVSDKMVDGYRRLEMELVPE